MTGDRPDDRRWLDQPRHVDRLVYGLFALCGLAFLADLFYRKQPHFGFEEWFGFYPAFGFVVSVSLVLAAKQLRRVLRRDEEYYEPLADSSEPVERADGPGEPPERVRDGG